MAFSSLESAQNPKAYSPSVETNTPTLSCQEAAQSALLSLIVWALEKLLLDECFVFSVPVFQGCFGSLNPLNQLKPLKPPKLCGLSRFWVLGSRRSSSRRPWTSGGAPKRAQGSGFMCVFFRFFSRFMGVEGLGSRRLGIWVFRA